MPRTPQFFAALALIAAPAAAQPAADSDATVAAARTIIAARYVLPEVAKALDAMLARNAAAGRYRGLSGGALADRLTADMAAVAHDKHLSVGFDPAHAERLAARPIAHGAASPGGALPPALARQIALRNAGVRELRQLPGNIRYLAYDGFWWGTPESEGALAAAMQFLRGGDAYIIDLRRNGGGSPVAVAAMASYFIPAGTPLMRFEIRGNPGEETRSPSAPFSLAGKPLYVLTSRGTASAAEEFATHVKALGFGTLIGTTTAGAGFRNDLIPLPGGYVLSVSTGRALSLKTGKDWEKVGVAPTIVTTVDDALVRAQAEAMALIAAAAPADERAVNARIADYYRSMASPVAPTRPVGDYAGKYGIRTVAVAGNGLTWRIDDRAPAALMPVGPDTFASDLDPTVRVIFSGTGARIDRLRVVQPDGSAQTLMRE